MAKRRDLLLPSEGGKPSVFVVAYLRCSYATSLREEDTKKIRSFPSGRSQRGSGVFGVAKLHLPEGRPNGGRVPRDLWQSGILRFSLPSLPSVAPLRLHPLLLPRTRTPSGISRGPKGCNRRLAERGMQAEQAAGASKGIADWGGGKREQRKRSYGGESLWVTKQARPLKPQT